MRNLLRPVDEILRGRATRPDLLRERGMDLSLVQLSLVLVALAAFYGACMGCFALFRVAHPAEVGPSAMQVAASALKTPLLFFLTLVVTFPSLYVFNALVGSRLNVLDVLRLLVAALAVNLAVSAAFGPIVAFFSASTESYAFMVLLNVVVLAVAGFLGLQFLVQTLHRLTSVLYPAARHEKGVVEVSPEAVQTPESSAYSTDFRPVNGGHESIGALDRTEEHALGRHVRLVFFCWMIVFGLVGAQMGWVLRPFIGAPSREFSWLRERESNFFEAVLGLLKELVS
jgi:hypothetical protein